MAEQDILVKDGRLVAVKYARTKDELIAIRAGIAQWKRAIRANQTPTKQDAVEFAQLAIRRWEEARVRNRTADSIQTIEEQIRNNKYAEVSVLLIAEAAWLKDVKIAGLCLFRRTWFNNVSISFLAVHPELDADPDSPVAGLGSGMLHNVISVAAKLRAGMIWGETTQNSASFYKVLTGSGTVPDLVSFRRKKYLHFQQSMEEKWRGKRADVKMSTEETHGIR